MNKTLLCRAALFILLPLLMSCLNENNQNDDAIKNEVELFIGSEAIKYPIGEIFPDREAVYMTVKDKTFNKIFHLETVNIEGFEYKEGFEYELKALRTLLLNPPADALNPHYSLIEIISTRKVE